MPSLSLTKRKKKNRDEAAEPSPMATGGRYRKLQDHQSPLLADVHSTSTVVRHSTAIRKSEQARNTRSHSVPSLHTVEPAQHPVSPSRKPRSNSVRASGTSRAGSRSIKNRLAKILGSHSDLSDKGNAASEQQRSGVYRPLGSGRPRSIGGSSDCSSSSLTSGPHQSDFSRHNSLRGSKVSQNSVFSSRQASYDSADALNYNFHPSMLGPAAHLSPIESGHRPKSIACMQRSGSNSSLKNSVLHSVNDPRYHSIAALPPRMEIPADLLFNPMMEERPPRPIRGGLQRGPTQPDEQPDFPSEDLTVLPSDPDYRKVAQNLMTCSPQPRSAEDCRHPPLDLYADSKKSPDELAEDISSVSRAVPPTSSSGVHTFVKGQDIRQIHSPKHTSPPAPSFSLTANPLLPPGWELVVNRAGTTYYVDHNTHTTHWKLPETTALNLPSGWEVVHSREYGTYFVNHNNRTAQYTNPAIQSRRPPPSYHEAVQDAEEDAGRRAPTRSHSHRSSQAHRVIDPQSSLPRRSKSFKDAAMAATSQESVDTDTVHTRQLSTMTYVPPSPFQIAEIPSWLKDYVDAPFGSEKDNLQWQRYPAEDLNGLDTMIKRLFKKSSEQVVKNCEYYRVALQQELDQRYRQQFKTRPREPPQYPSREPPQYPPSGSRDLPYYPPTASREQYPPSASREPPRYPPTGPRDPPQYPPTGPRDPPKYPPTGPRDPPQYPPTGPRDPPQYPPTGPRDPPQYPPTGPRDPPQYPSTGPRDPPQYPSTGPRDLPQYPPSVQQYPYPSAQYPLSAPIPHHSTHQYPPSNPPTYPVTNLRPLNGVIPTTQHLPTHSMPNATNPDKLQQHQESTQNQDDFFNGLEETFV